LEHFPSNSTTIQNSQSHNYCNKEPTQLGTAYTVRTFVSAAVLDANVNILDRDLEVLEDIGHQLLDKGVAAPLLLTRVYSATDKKGEMTVTHVFNCTLDSMIL
jgi:hypothetical protein